MSPPRPLPKFEAAHFESLSHEEKLAVLNDFLDALDRAGPSSNAKAEQPAALAPKRARTSS